MTRQVMTWEMCCRDLRRYLEAVLTNSRGGVISVKTSRVAQDKAARWSYGQCLASLLRRYKLRTAYVLTRDEARELLRNLDCTKRSVARKKDKTGRKPRRRPPLFGEKMVLISIHLPPPMLQILDEYAARLGTTRSAVIRYAISEMLQQIRRFAEKQTILPTQAAP